LFKYEFYLITGTINKNFVSFLLTESET